MRYNKEEQEYFMKQALIEADKAWAKAEVPIGAVVVYQGEIIGRGHNLREISQDATTHAEMIAIRQANQAINSWRLEECSLFVTLEPCTMCSGAIILSRIEEVYYGARDPKAGAVDSLLQLLQDSRFNHQSIVISGLLEEQCANMLRTFFKELRVQKKIQKKLEKTSN